ncbi:MAG: hypothetical protein EKK40_08070 [Bradyrhizobiaceae bacterium]|nr:MAG: hypothetical protein EKK40_08070 [Bradyrhizobiaceae bacterium]
MSGKGIKSDLEHVDRHQISDAEYGDAPEFTDDMLKKAVIREGDKVIHDPSGKAGKPSRAMAKDL